MSNNLSFKTVDDLAKLDPRYLRQVMRHMRYQETVVQFGQTGSGQTPNYQTCFQDETKIPRHGNSPKHKKFQKTEQFDEANLSRPFSYQEIQQAIAKKS